MYALLERVYSNKKLKINGSKTQFITITQANEDSRKIKLQIDENETLEETETMKILGFIQNRNNTMDTHLNAISAKVSMLLSKIRPAFPYLNEDTRKQIITLKVKSVALYGLQLVIGQSQSVIQRSSTILMRINRAMTSNLEGLRSTEALCNKLKID